MNGTTAEPATRGVPGDAEVVTQRLGDWDWEAIRAGGKLYLFCYMREKVIPLAPFDFAE